MHAIDIELIELGKSDTALAAFNDLVAIGVISISIAVVCLNDLQEITSVFDVIAAMPEPKRSYAHRQRDHCQRIKDPSANSFHDAPPLVSIPLLACDAAHRHRGG